MKQLRVDEIKTDRDVDAVAPRQGLTLTYKQPIVVLEDGTLVDGLYRLAAAKAAGLEYVPVVVVSDFVKATELLAKVHEGRPAPPRRAWEIISILEPMAKAWSYGQRAHNAKVMKKGDATMKPVGVRSRLRMAAGLKYDQIGEQIRRLYRKAEAGDDRALTLVEKVDRGELTVGQAHSLLTGEANLSGDIRTKPEQKVLLETGPQRLASVMQSLARLGSPVQLDPALIKEALDSLMASRTQLTIMINRLRKELPSE